MSLKAGAIYLHNDVLAYMVTFPCQLEMLASFSFLILYTYVFMTMFVFFCG